MEFRWGSDGLVAETISIALAAGSVILEGYATDFAVATKADSSPVIEANQRATAVILAGPARLALEIAVVAEEECAAGRLPATGERFFLVDPLDGTKELLARNGEFTVNIALVEDGAPVAGVVYAPALGELYTGGDGRPLTYNKRRRAHDEPFANPHFLAFGDHRFVEAAVAPAS